MGWRKSWGITGSVGAVMEVAILVDGGFFLRRLPHFYGRSILSDPDRADAAIGRLIDGHLRRINRIAQVPNRYSLLYRCFFYDALPYSRLGHLPVSKRAIDYSKSHQSVFRLALFERLRRRPNFALRLGEVRRDREWIIKERAQKDLLNGRRAVSDLTDDDFLPGFQQKAVDMRIGMDIATLTLKKQADTIVLIAGDSDFVPAARMARREGARIILDPLWQNVAPDLFEHIDQLNCPFPRPNANPLR